VERSKTHTSPRGEGKKGKTHQGGRRTNDRGKKKKSSGTLQKTVQKNKRRKTEKNMHFGVGGRLKKVFVLEKLKKANQAQNQKFWR